MKRRSPRLRPAAVAVAAAVLAAIPAIPAQAYSCAFPWVRWGSFALDEYTSQPPLIVPPSFYWGPEGGNAVVTAWFNEWCVQSGGSNTGTATWTTVAGTASTADYQADTTMFNVSNPEPMNPHTAASDNRIITLTDDSLVEPTFETFKVKFTGGSSFLAPPTEADVHIVDNDGSTRYATVGGGPFNVFEKGGKFKFPIFRAGDASDLTVGITYAGGVNGVDFNGPSTLTFGSSERFKIATITPVDDSTPESNQTVTATLTGATIDGPSSMSFTIIDNDGGSGDTTAPKTWFHHPRHNKDYAHGSYKSRTIHVFAPTEDVDSPHGPMEPSGIDKVQAALKRKKTNGNCQWWTAARTWKGGKCGAQKWFKVNFDFKLASDRYLYAYDLLTDLKPSKGTKIKYYQVYSRAEDGAGNMENKFEIGRNKNKFEINKK